jgi:GntR family transcriptional regulator, rspAB operon transcriptional repressor
MRNQKNKKSMVYDILKKRIIDNSMKPGEPLIETVLSKEMKISKTPVREALQQLERDGFVENVPGRGCFVSRISFQDIKELFEIREILECEVVKRAVTKCDAESIAAVRTKFEFQENADEKSARTSFKAGDRIHLHLFESFGNNRLKEIYRRLQDHVERMRIYFFNQDHEERSKEAYQEHIEILDALVARNADRAERAVRTHLRNSIEFLKNVI